MFNLKNFRKLLMYVYEKVVMFDYEFNVVMSCIDTLGINKDNSILDVGSGYGRYLIPLSKKGYNIVGVEKNKEMVVLHKSNQLNCMYEGDLKGIDNQFDIMIMSHIIEHFSPNDLKEFMDHYLDRLNIGGYLIIATPLMSDYFYDDFDHIKPYHPTGISMVFGKSNAQVQYYSRNKLELNSLWYRKSFYRASYVKSKNIKNGVFSICYRVIVFMSAFLSYFTNGYIGKKDGWVGVFRKVE